MENKISFFIFLAAAFFAVSYSAKSRDRNTKPYKMVCYHAAWSYWRDVPGKYSPKYINAHSCTHVVYAFAVLKDNKIESHDPWQDYQVVDDGVTGHYKLFNNLRQRNPQLTTLIAIGGWNEGNLTENHKYSKMVESPATRKIFVDSVVQFLKDHDFDGLDFDWEYPVLREGISRPQDRKNFVLVLKELKEAFEPHGFLLTAAVAAGKDTMEAGYDIPEVNKYLDIINIMAYDFHGAFDNYTGHNSPVYARSDESDEDKYKNLDYAVRYWIDQGADKKKITLGIPLYGRCHTLKDSKKTGYGAPSAGNGTQGHLTKQDGMLGYNELCLKDKRERWTTQWNECHLAPYMYSGDQWCGYDDEQSVLIKVQYAKAMDLGGAMVWSVDTDDFQGECSGKKYPLLTKIVDALEDTEKAQLPKLLPNCISTSTKPIFTTTTRPTPTPTPTPSTTPRPTPPTPSTIDCTWKPTNENLKGLCTRYGVVALPNECYKFVQCVPHGMDFVPVIKDCPEGTAFHAAVRNCDYKYNVRGCEYGNHVCSQ